MCTASLPAHRETDRGQEFDLTTTASVNGAAIWSETSTFLARRRAKGANGAKAQGAAKAPRDETPAAVQTTSWRADADIGRRYAVVSGDYNLIHISDLTARLFGFNRAIAHGLWSLARTAAELRPRLTADGVVLVANFKLPILLPAWVTPRAGTSLRVSPSTSRTRRARNLTWPARSSFSRAYQPRGVLQGAAAARRVTHALRPRCYVGAVLRAKHPRERRCGGVAITSDRPMMLAGGAGSPSTTSRAAPAS